MEEYFRDHFDVYYQALEIMKERADNEQPNNEGVLFFKIEEGM